MALQRQFIVRLLSIMQTQYKHFTKQIGKGGKQLNQTASFALQNQPQGFLDLNLNPDQSIQSDLDHRPRKSKGYEY
jgi:hypothetical protein